MLFFRIKRKVDTMKRFEYETIIFDPKGVLGGKVDSTMFDQTLNNMGNQGWELINMVASNASYGITRHIVCVFKREIA